MTIENVAKHVSGDYRVVVLLHRKINNIFIWVILVKVFKNQATKL